MTCISEQANTSKTFQSAWVCSLGCNMARVLLVPVEAILLWSYCCYLINPSNLDFFSCYKEKA